MCSAVQSTPSGRHDIFDVDETMEDDSEEVSEWKKLKGNLTVNKPLIPLKLTMLLYYGGTVID